MVSTSEGPHPLTQAPLTCPMERLPGAQTNLLAQSICWLLLSLQGTTVPGNSVTQWGQQQA